MGLVIAPLLLIACVLYVAYPLMREEGAEDLVIVDEAKSKRDVLMSRKEQLILNIKDIEMDYRMGKLSDEDHRRLKAEFEGRALEVLKNLDQLDHSKDLTDRSSSPS